MSLVNEAADDEPTKSDSNEVPFIAELAASQNRYWKILTEAFGGISLISADGRILYEGVGSAHLLGHTHGTDLGRPVWSRIHPDDLPKTHELFEKVLAEPGASSSKVVARGLHVDGNYRWIEATLTNYLQDPEIKAIVCHWHDVTKWIEAEHALSQLSRFHGAVIQTAAEGICVAQILESFPYLRFSVWNKRLTEITGYTLEQINRQGWLQALPAGSQQRALSRLQELARGREARAEEWTIVRRDGTKRVVSVSTSRIEKAPLDSVVVLLLEDVTQRWQAQRDLELEERRLRTALQAAGMISWDSDLRTRRIQFSADVGTYFGSQVLSGPGPFPGENATLLIAPHHRDLVDKAYRNSQIGSGDFSVEWQGCASNADGSARWFATLGKILLDAEGNPERTCGVTWEITERRRAEEERRALERQIQEAHRFESLGILAGGIAHEFNNLLTSILGFACLAKDELSKSVPARAHMVHIENASIRAAELCSQMLAAAGRGQFVLAPVDLSQLVRETMVRLKAILPRPTMLSLALAEDPPELAADASQLRQLLVNLVKNAGDALGEREGTIAITTGTQSLDRTYLSSCVHAPELAPGTYVFLEVSDDGPGMSAEITGRIFEPFYSTRFTGRGMGLAAVLGIVRGHSGAIHVSSQPGEGAKFRVFLPPAGPHKTPAPPPLAAAAPPQSQGPILVVDDEPRIRNLALRMLQNAGYPAIEANDGVEAIERLGELAGKVRLVLMDLTMPRLDGIQTAREMRRQMPGVPIILMSGFSEHELSEQASGMQALRFLQKPFNQQAFLEAVRTALAAAGESPGIPAE